MARLPRVTQKIFASTSGANQVAQIGSLFAGTPNFTTDIAVAQALVNFTEGLFNICIGNNSPAIEDVNGIFLVLTQQLAYLMQAGVPEWDTGTTYYIGSVAQDGSGNQFVSLTNGNVGNALSDTTNWKGASGVLPIGSVIATFPNLTGAYVCAATTAADAQGYVKCNGQVISDASSPMNGQTIPNINNNVFLMGSTTAGSAGGSNNTTLTTTQLPSHTHGAGSFATSLSGTFAATGHVHNFAHTHVWGATNGSLQIFTRFASDTSSSSTTPSNNMFINTVTYTSGAASSVYDAAASVANQTYWTSGVAANAGGSGTGNSASTGTESSDASLSGSNSVSGTSSSTGSGTAYDSRPSFISSVYIMRIR